MVKEEKIQKVEALKKVIESYRLAGIVEMHKMPSAQLQEIRRGLRMEFGGDVLILMVKKSALKFAIDRIGKNELKRLEDYIGGQPAIILSNIGAFKLYSWLSRLKFPSFAKEGDIAPHDIDVHAGPTSLMPGPVISEFQRVGIAAGIEEGKIAIKKDKTVVKSGESISGPLSNVLRKLNIKPMEITLNVIVLLEAGQLYPKDVLELVETFPLKLPVAFNNALNLSVSIAYPTRENINLLLAKCYNAAIAIQSISTVKTEVAEAKTDSAVNKVESEIEGEQKEKIAE